jgi:hypothetical protein
MQLTTLNRGSSWGATRWLDMPCSRGSLRGLSSGLVRERSRMVFEVRRSFDVRVTCCADLARTVSQRPPKRVRVQALYGVQIPSSPAAPGGWNQRVQPPDRHSGVAQRQIGELCCSLANEFGRPRGVFEDLHAAREVRHPCLQIGGLLLFELAPACRRVLPFTEQH